MAHRPATLDARRRILTAASRFEEPFTIEDVWATLGRGAFPSYQHVQTLLRELFVEGSLVVDHQPGRARKPVLYRWAEK